MVRGWVFAGIVLGAGWGLAQSSRPAFEVASIKLNTRCDTNGMSGGRSTPGRIEMECADLRDLILTAYGIYGSGPNPAAGSFRMQVIGGPSWMDSTRYDILAKPAGNPPRAEMYGPMLQSLLEERFGLKVHTEAKDGPVYFLTVAKSGAKLVATKEGACVPAAACGTPKISSGGSIVNVDIPGETMSGLCAQLGLRMDREVIDKTGLTGRFDIHLEVTPADLHPQFVAGHTVTENRSDDQDGGPSISSALQQQLGLRLESGKGTVKAIVVDHIERPTEN
jgi:uncharacterized protein (TIGR03435 family)